MGLSKFAWINQQSCLWNGRGLMEYVGNPYLNTTVREAFLRQWNITLNELQEGIFEKQGKYMPGRLMTLYVFEHLIWSKHCLVPYVLSHLIQQQDQEVVSIIMPTLELTPTFKPILASSFFPIQLLIHFHHSLLHTPNSIQQ